VFCTRLGQNVGEKSYPRLFHACRLKEYLPYESRPDEQIILDEDAWAGSSLSCLLSNDITPSSRLLSWRVPSGGGFKEGSSFGYYGQEVYASPGAA
jgi:hypothetical protein